MTFFWTASVLFWINVPVDLEKVPFCKNDKSLLNDSVATKKYRIRRQMRVLKKVPRYIIFDNNAWCEKVPPFWRQIPGPPPIF